MKKTLIACLVLSALLFVGCAKTSSGVSLLVSVLEDASSALAIGTPVIVAVYPAAAPFLAAAQPVLASALDIAEGTSALSTASQVAGQFQLLISQGNAISANLPPAGQVAIQTILAAFQAVVQNFQQQAPPPASNAEMRMIRAAYRLHLVSSPVPPAAKFVPSKKDLASIKRSRKHLEKAAKALQKAAIKTK